MLSFPEGHFALIKRAQVDIGPFLHSSAEKMGAFLMALGTSGAKLVDLLIRIRMLDVCDKTSREHDDTLPPLSLFDQALLGDHPIVAGLFSLKAVQKLVIQMEDEARFGPDVANALREAFMTERTADGRSITMEHVCSFPHKLLEEEETCPHCENTLKDLVNGTVNWEYKDDMLTRRAVEKYNSLSRKLKKGEQRKAKSVTGKATKAKEPQTEAAATYHNTTIKQTREYAGPSPKLF